ncbi:MAG: transglycosylase SLT domain-containing protein [Muribaculaceae bacterium]|nr:transglycosylase SLT domain-containing protein [Muribaculaceae bacterium]
MNRITTLLLIAAATLSLIAAPRTKNNILTIKESITDNDIVFPESFETNTHELMKNWYLQNYTVLDAEVENRDAGEVSDAEYIKRLQAMPTIIEMPYNQIVRSYIERYIKRNRTLVEEMLGMSLYYMPIFEQALEREGLPLELKYLPVIESALDPNAVSRAGAAGLWQFMVGTGKGLGLEVNTLVDERRDPYKSSEKAAAFLKDLYSIYGDWSLAIAAYNCGPGNVNKALRRAGGENKDFWEIYEYLPHETRGYVPAFIAANYVMTYFKHHNISASLASKPLITDTVGITRRVHFNQISQVLNMPVEEIRALNPQYRHDVIPGSNERSYTLVLPSRQVYSYIMSEDSIAAYRPDIYAQRATVEPGGGGESVETGGSSSEPRIETHKVRRGETYSGIAAQYGMDLDDLLALNGLTGGKARRGQTLKVQNRKAQREAGEADGDGIRVVQHDENGNELAQSDLEQENEQIEEVRQVEQAAQDSRTHRRQVDTPVPPKPKAKADAPTSHPTYTQQSHKRNERYADNKKSANTSRENTYKKSHSSSNKDEAKQRRHSRKTQAKPTEYNVKKGETLSEISERTGVPVATIKEANDLKDDRIRAGESLKLTPPASSKGKKGGKGTNAAKGAKGAKAAKGSKASKADQKGKSTSKSSGKGGTSKRKGKKGK